MAAPAPPAETRKPASPPPAKAGKPAGEKAADAKAGKASDQTKAGQPGKPAAGDKGQAASQQRFDRLAVRAKLAVSQPGDAVEREADAVAESISRKFDRSTVRHPGPADAGRGGRREAAHKGTDAPAAPSKTETPNIARAAAPDAPRPSAQPPAEPREDAAGAAASPDRDDPRTRVGELRGKGEPMEDDVRERMEREFAHDFSHVRIHTDTQADDLCRSLHALAFTTGSDIFFAAGRYQPHTKGGIALLAHELAHVVQQQDSGPVVARKINPDMEAQYKPKNQAATDAALKALGKLDIPAVKARHLASPYQKLASAGKLKRKRGYDRGHPAQVDKWNKEVEVPEARIRQRLTQRGLKNVPADASESFPIILGNKTTPQSKSVQSLQGLLKIPTWSRHGKPVGNGFQVDHIVELQVSGEDGEGTGNSVENMELLDQPSNSSSGGAIRAAIYKKVDTYLQTFTDPIPKRTNFLKAHDLVFESVAASLGMGSAAGASSWWSVAEIRDAKPLETVQPAPPSDAEGSDKEFLLADAPKGVVIQKFPHPAGPGTFDVTGTAQTAIAGLKLSSVTVNAQAATGSGGVGSLAATWNLPKKWTPATSDVTVALTGDGKYRGYPSKIGKTSLSFEHLSPVSFDNVVIEDGGLSAEGLLTPSIPLLKAPIRVTLRGNDVRFSLDYSAKQLDLNAKGVEIQDALVSVSYSTSDGFSVGGGFDFSVAQVDGSMQASFSEGKGFEVAGQVDFRNQLFDTAKISAWWRQADGFGVAGDLAITKPNKIKGLKSATLKASYADGAFTAKGDAVTDIPGIKGFTAEVKFLDADDFSVTGSGDFEQLPGIESGSLTLTLDRASGAWSLSGSGTAVPKLPGGAKAAISAKYDKGLVVITGDVTLTYGTDLITGSVKATVTNAANVSKEGVPSGNPTDRFKVFGTGSIAAKIGPITGQVDVDLQPAGDVLIGGKLTLADQKLFDEYPKNGGKPEGGPKLHPIVSVPIPGLGFGVGGINVGVVLGAKWGFNAYASIGAAWARDIHITIAKFNPKDFKPSDIKVEDAGARLECPATAGVSLSAAIELTLEAAAVRGGARLTATAAAEIPKDPPAITGTVKFTWSYDDGLDFTAGIKVKPTAQLKFSLVGTGFAELNLLVDTVTLWSRDWPLGDVAYQLPLNFEVGADMGWNSKTGFRTQPAELFKPPALDLGSDDFARIVDGRPSTQTIVNVDENTGKVLHDDDLVCREPTFSAEPNTCSVDDANACVNPAREHDADAMAAPDTVDEDVVNRLGRGMPLDLATRGFFEQHLEIDLSRVRIHTGPPAAREAERLGARAFTVGQHIAFARGEYQPDTPEGQELIAHELAHVAQGQGGGAIVLRWPAVTRTPARTSETPATVRAMKLADFVSLTHSQLDWATSPDLQADPASLGQFRQIQSFADGPRVVDACGDLGMADILGKGVPGIFPTLNKYRDGVTSDATAWLRRTAIIDEAERWGRGLASLEAAWPAANLHLVMQAPDPVSTPSPFEKLTPAAAPELPSFIAYLTACTPVLSAENGAEVDSFLALRAEGATPASYLGTVRHVKDYHHFTKNTLDGLASNEAFPHWQQALAWTRRPLTVVLYPAVDHNGAFHRNAGLEAMVLDTNILTIVVEGLATVADYRAQLAPVAARYGVGGRIQQAMIAGHGNATVLGLAGTAGAAISGDDLGTTGATGANTTSLMTELTRLMSSDPARRRIILDACLTNSHQVTTALRAAPADAAADVNAAITADPSLRDVVAGIAGSGATVLGSSSSFAPGQTTFVRPGSSQLGLSVPDDPDLTADKLTYVEFGTEPEGCMRAVLECWAQDQLAGTHRCRDAMQRRITAGRSTHAAATDSWRECIIQTLYYLTVNHYLGNGEAIREMGELAGSLFLLYWPGFTTAASLDAALGVFAGNAAHIGRVLGGPAGDPHYAATPRVAVVIEQDWMEHDPARHANFLAALGRYANCLQAAADLDMGIVMRHVAALLTLPPASPPPAAQFMLALLAAHQAPLAPPLPAVLPPYVDFLRSLLGAGPTFPAALNINTVLGGLCAEEDILAAIGRPLGRPAAAVGGRPPPPAANIDTVRDASSRNEFYVTPLRRNGVVATVRDDLLVRSTPTTGSSANIFAHLPTGTPVFVIGQYSVDWYAIEQPGRTGFVASRYITLLP